MSSDSKHMWTIIGTGAVLAGLMLTQGSSVSRRIDRLDDRLRAVEIGLVEVKVLVTGSGLHQAGGEGRLTLTPPPPPGN